MKNSVRFVIGFCQRADLIYFYQNRIGNIVFNSFAQTFHIRYKQIIQLGTLQARREILGIVIIVAFMFTVIYVQTASMATAMLMEGLFLCSALTVAL
jgi:hypothetical protein